MRLNAHINHGHAIQPSRNPFVVRDIDAYNRFLDGFMFRLPGIRHVRTNMVLREIKSTVALPFDGD